jgi:hypothetical protein
LPWNAADFGVVRVDYAVEDQEGDAAPYWEYDAPAVLYMRTVTAPLAGLYRPYNLSEECPFEDDEY